MPLNPPPAPANSALDEIVRLMEAGRAAEAAEALYPHVQRHPGDASARFLMGLAHHMIGRRDAALADYDQAIALAPQMSEAHYNRGVCLHDLRRFADAIAGFETASTQEPTAFAPHYRRGLALLELGRRDAALAAYDQAIALNPDAAEIYVMRGDLLCALDQPLRALADYDRALALDPRHATAVNNRGNALKALDRSFEALASYQRAAALNPTMAEAHHNAGSILQELHRWDEAAVSFKRALMLRSDYVQSAAGLANVLMELSRYGEAAAAFDRALTIEPRFALARGLKLHCDMYLCDWSSLDRQTKDIVEDIAEGARTAVPFSILPLPLSAAQQRACAEIYAKSFVVPATEISIKLPRKKIRLGYVSAEFHDHALMTLIAELLETHDRSRFEIFGLSHRPSPDDAMRRRLIASFDRFVDVREKSESEITETARNLDLDIAVDLTGYTANHRIGVFMRRIAPVQIHYLGYPGTLGNPFIDYLVADPVIIPAAERIHYTEKIIALPDSYQANDTQRRVAELKMTRQDAGLPTDGTVFCAFNNTFKITPDVFDSWMRILGRVPDSVLWLMDGDKTATANLRAEAEKRGIASDRLVFAPRLDRAEHLARHALADLFLDTFHYNAHTTASDALWTGLPVLTLLGRTFAGRVAASLLNAVGLSELVAHDVAQYEDMAVALGTTVQQRRDIKRRLKENIRSAPLFDTKRFARHIEDGYTRAWNRYLSGLPPDHIDVPALAL